ncbi:MAG: sensor histidine kinase [Alphaproteobacteria bacterium]|nr:sensor histidine kinase [Alphaproteobacteria bacterium]MBU1512919.1 sensor histidine kinase [Alphaproteobacteria bacterium]MBU2096640.1 sensor histidine kinase [Alphaproteobacteria bacterium]MBU2150523.1 sensor histidine kinase [Alphaproteobacteria bacterium]MBU2306548.1 sensor histidine kinase [Alphaproteobacteria bacterium]
MTDFLVRRIAGQPRSPAARIALGLALAALALGIRLALAIWIGLGAPFAAFVLAVLVATVLGGWVSGVACMLALAAGGVTLLEPQADPIAARRLVLGVAFFLASSSFVIWVVTLLRSALTREMAAREGERLLKLELHHRVKNTLAVVQSLADQTLRGATDTEAARHDFAARLAALSDAHDVLVDAGWREVTLEALAARALAPFRPAPADRLTLDGPPVTVAPEAAVALSLCLHELATNAAKHGALSGPDGRVRLIWRVDETAGRRRLTLDWTETGGPAPGPGGRRGFGNRLLTRALAAQPGATADLSLPPEGARWRAGFDL